MFGTNVGGHDHVGHFKTLRHFEPILTCSRVTAGANGRKASRIFTMALILSTSRDVQGQQECCDDREHGAQIPCARDTRQSPGLAG